MKSNKGTLKCIFFDCMETLVDLTELPAIRDYAAWAFYGSGVERFFGDYENFLKLYIKAKCDIANELENDREYEMINRFERIVRLTSDSSKFDVEHVKQALYTNYWKNYKERCYVREEIKEILPLLHKHFRLCVVSNFMVDGGIEELLEINGIRKYFNFVVTSIREGWKKPDTRIYDAALKYSGVTANEVLFVGDDYVNDCITPVKLGMTAVLLDRSKLYDQIENRAVSFYELEKIINKR